MVGVFVASAYTGGVSASFDNRDDVAQWLNATDSVGFSKAQVAQYLAQTKAKPSIIPILKNAPEGKWLWSDYQRRLVSKTRIKRGRDFVNTHREKLDLVTQQTGVDAEIIAAIAGIESNYGANMGKHLTLRVLATLSFDYPRRSGFYQRQLAEFFRLCFSQGLDPTTVKGSAAGAIGMGQFIPTSYRDFAVDGDGDNRVDLFNSKADNIASIANYLARHQWQAGQPWILPVDTKVDPTWVSKKAKRSGDTSKQWRQRGITLPATVEDRAEFNLYAFSTAGDDEYRLAGANFYAITRYNHSLWYSRAVVEIAQGISAL